LILGRKGVSGIPKTMELGTARRRPGSQEKAPEKVFINCVRKLAF